MYKNLLQNDYNKKFFGLEKSEYFNLRGKPQIVQKGWHKKNKLSFLQEQKFYFLRYLF